MASPTFMPLNAPAEKSSSYFFASSATSCSSPLTNS